jgi:hypothetical protein
MAYKLNPEDENPLWRNYMNNVDMNNPKWLKDVNLGITSSTSKSFGTLSEEEFLDKLKVDEDFRKRWGN